MKSLSSISPNTKLCGIIGDPVEHSMSPALHNRAFEQLELDFAYLAFRVEPGRVATVLDAMRIMGNFRGLSVTIPHKVEVCDLVDDLSEADAAIGSINTVINDNGRLRGLGSDGPGARQALRDAEIPLAGNRVVMLGTGGAARAIALDLAFHAPPSHIQLLGVVEDEMKQLARDIADKSGVPVDGRMLGAAALSDALSGPAVVINATPVGMHPKVDQSVVPADLLHPELSVMDIVYNPLETKLLADARRTGLKTVSGLEMFVNQAVIQFENWTGKTAPLDLMRSVVLERLTGK